MAQVRTKDFNLSVTLFQGMAEADMALLRPLLVRATYRAGEPIYSPGQVGEGFVYLLEAGRVRLGLAGTDGREITLDYMDAGAIFGALGFALTVTQQPTVIAVVPAVVYKIPAEPFLDFVSSCPGVLLELTRMLGERLALIQLRCHHLIFADVRSRLLVTLRYMAERYGEPVEGGVRIGLRLTHHDLARLTASTRETVSQIVSALRHEGVLMFIDKYPVLINSPAPVVVSAPGYPPAATRRRVLRWKTLAATPPAPAAAAAVSG